jgi:hypothetical protein
LSEEELVGAYSHGRISRRIFVRGLMAAGVSAVAAIAYAENLSPAGAAVPSKAAVHLTSARAALH